MVYKKYIKRIIDILISAFAMILLLPFIFILVLILFIQNQGKVFFIQSRPGKYEKAFNLIKFKSMNDKCDADGNLLPDVKRITPVGKILRRFSLDELPQLINVLKGEMSLVGPRPLLFKYIPLYSPEQRRRHEVLPGITGWAQVNGRNAISWKNKFEYDIYYVNNVSFILDIKILILTIKKVLKSEGVNQSAERPMQPFNGNN